VNVNQTEWRSDAPNPISVSQITGEHYDLKAALAVLREKIMQRYEMLRRGEKEALRQSYFEMLYRQDDFYSYQDAAGTFHAEIEDVEPIGTLLLRLENGELRRYAFKEVSFI
jgi:BirA family biotin operon repressor/biotin-[acetyl-CoA-carboxylase] ligase